MILSALCSQSTLSFSSDFHGVKVRNGANGTKGSISPELRSGNRCQPCCCHSTTKGQLNIKSQTCAVQQQTYKEKVLWLYMRQKIRNVQWLSYDLLCEHNENNLNYSNLDCQHSSSWRQLVARNSVYTMRYPSLTTVLLAYSIMD